MNKKSSKDKKIIFIGDFQQEEIRGFLLAFLDKYANNYSIAVSGYNFSAIQNNSAVTDRAVICSMNSDLFLYYKNTAHYAVITTEAARYMREKNNQEIIYILDSFDFDCFAGVMADISRIIIKDESAASVLKATFSHIAVSVIKEGFDEVLESLSPSIDASSKNYSEYMLISTNCESSLKEINGARHYLHEVLNDGGTVIALTNTGGIKASSSNITFRNNAKVKAILKHFNGTLVFYDEVSKLFFDSYLEQNGIEFNCDNSLQLWELKLLILENHANNFIGFDSDDDISEYSKYRILIEELYKTNNCQEVKVSIIICRYNTPYDLLNRAIKSVFNSGHNNVEIIVVDDGSDESLESKLRDIYSDDRLKYYYKHNEGLGLSREYGIKRSSGKYVFFLDSDDTLHFGSLRALVAHAEFFGLKLVIGKRMLCDEKGIPRSESLKFLAGESYRCYYGDGSNAVVYADVMVNNKLIDRAFLEQKNIHFLKGLYEDIEYSARLYGECDEYHYVNVVIHDWYQYGKGTTISSTPSLLNFKERIEKEELAWRLIPENAREKRLFNVLSLSFDLYLNNYYLLSDEERESVWQVLQRYFAEKSEYITPDYYPERIKELSKALVQNNQHYFDFVIKRFYSAKLLEDGVDDYVVFTHYHLYVAILRAISSGRKSRVFIGLFYATFDTNLIYRLRKTGIFESVKTFTYGNLVGNLFKELGRRPGEEDIVIPNHLYNFFASIFKECDVKKDTMFIFSDTHPYWYYIEREFENIVKLEDAYNSFDREIKTHKMTGIWAGIQEYEGRYYPKMFYRSEKIQKYVLSSLPKDLPAFYDGKVEIDDTKEKVELAKDDLRDALLFIYGVDASVFKNDSVLLLTQPLAQFGYCTRSQQKRLMQIMCGSYSRASLVIKPHPADKMDYSYLGGTVLPRSVPIEVYNLMDVDIAAAVTFGSSAIETVTFAREKKVFFKLHDFEYDDVVHAIKRIAGSDSKFGARTKKRLKRRIKNVLNR